MKKKILSITVPAYNAEDYLNKCLDSFLVDNYELRNKLEVLVINDGSTDNTASIAREYEEKYPTIFRLINKENGGHGSGINTGIQNAKGCYFKVVDADDWLDRNELADFIKLLDGFTEKPDVVASDFICVDDKSGDVIKKINSAGEESMYGNVYSLNHNRIARVIKMHSLTIKTSVLKEHFRPVDEHCFYVDAEYITFPVPFVDTIYYDKRYLYIYRLGRAGQSMSLDKLQRNKDMHRKVLDRLIEFYDEVMERYGNDMNQTKIQYLERCIGDMVDNQFQIYISLGNKSGIREELRQWDQELRRTHKELYAATSKKSIDILRKTNYHILFAGYIAHKVLKG